MDRYPISRRKYLSSVGVGFSAIGLSPLFKRQVNIPLLKSQDSVVMSANVSKKWWDHVQKSKESVSKLQNKMKNESSISSIHRRKTADQIGGRYKQEIVVQIKDDSVDSGKKEPGAASSTPEKPIEVPAELPTEVNGLNIATERSPKLEPLGCNNVQDFNNIPGGSGIFLNMSKGTAFPVKYNGTRRLLTAAHVDSCYAGGTYTSDAQGNSEIGQSITNNSTYDFSVVECTNSSKSIDDTVRRPNGTRYPIKGYVTEQGVENYYDSGRDFIKIGAESGLKKNNIKDIYRTDSSEMDCATHSHGIDYNADGAKGDSGGPVFLLTDNDTAFILSITQYGWGGWQTYGCTGKEVTNYTGGVAAWKVQKETGVNFDVA